MKQLLFLGFAFAVFCLSHSVPDFCYLAHDEGQGTGFIFSLYYNPEKDECHPFLYKGEGGNDNRFEKERDCIRNCSVNAEKIYPSVASQACRLKKINGGCSGSYLRYYYDAVHDKCKKFLWTGCMGNGNRFFDFNSCNATCEGIHEDGTEDEEDEPDTPIAIIAGVLLSVIIVAILLTAILMVVSSKKKKKSKKNAREQPSESPLKDQAIEMS